MRLQLQYFEAFDFYHLGRITPDAQFSSLDHMAFSSMLAVGLAIEGPLHGMALVLIDQHADLHDDLTIAQELGNILGSQTCDRLGDLTRSPVTLTAPEALSLNEVEKVAENWNQIYRKDFIWTHRDGLQSRVRLMVFGLAFENSRAHQEITHDEVIHRAF